MSSPLPFFLLPLLPMTGNLPTDIAASATPAAPASSVVLVAPTDSPPARRPAAAPVATPVVTPACPTTPAAALDSAATQAAPTVSRATPRLEPSAVLMPAADVQCFR